MLLKIPIFYTKMVGPKSAENNPWKIFMLPLKFFTTILFSGPSRSRCFVPVPWPLKCYRELSMG